MKGLQPQMVVALLMVDSVTGRDFTVTSGTEDAPNRIPDSLHPKGFALDIRVPKSDVWNGDHWLTPWGWREQMTKIFEDTEFDVVWYETHVHIEFDPK